jgi:outer membrane protein OmpA-like peptidoglycan-associated protein
MKNKLLLLIFLLAANLIDAQSLKLKRANRHFDHLAYQSAIDLFEEYDNLKSNDSELLFRLAMSYYHTNQMKKAADTFARYINPADATADELFYYAQALKQIGSNVEGDEKLKLIAERFNTDSRALSLLANLNYLNDLKKPNQYYSLKNLNINSEFSDFGGYPFSGSVVFLSSKYELLSVKREWSWNGTKFLDAFLAKEENGELVEQGMLNQICSKYHEGPICSNGQMGFYFTRNNGSKSKIDRNGIQNLSLYYAEIDKFGSMNITKLPFCSEEYSVGHPALSKDGKTLYFSSDMPGSEGVDIYQVSIDGYLQYGIPTKVSGKVNTEGDELFPYVGSNGALYFSSNGHIGLGGLDVFVQKFNGEIENLGQPLNSINDDFAFVIKNNNKAGFVSSNRVGGKGDDDIYAFSYSGSVEILISGSVTDSLTNMPIPNTTVTLYNEGGAVVGTFQTDSEGKYLLTGNTGENYKLSIQNGNYDAVVVNIPKSDSEITKNVKLIDEGIELVFEIKNKKTQEGIEGAIIQLQNSLNGENVKILTGENGLVSFLIDNKKLGETIDFNLILSKDGYLTKKLNLKFIANSKTINVGDFMEISLSKLEVGGDIAELISINPIYFDLGKWSIRKDAALELDKIVGIMNEYPNMVIELGSHTDCRSTKSFNQKLSDNRAKASADYIKKRISKPTRIAGVGYGESRLKVNCPCEGTVKSDCSEEEHQKNRRTEFIIKSID